MRSSDLMHMPAQTELGLSRRPLAVFVPIEIIRSKKTKGAAFTLACDTSGLEDKEIAGAMTKPIDAGTFSRIKSGLNTLDADLITEFCAVVGNLVYPEWCAYQVGCQLVMIQTEAERKLAIEHTARAKAEAENVLLRGLLMGKAA